LNHTSELQDFEFRVVTIRVRILVNLKRVVPIASSSPFISDRVDIVREDLYSGRRSDRLSG
jgi:hypothetical protein